MKRSLTLIIISILLAQCSSAPEQTVINVASDIIPKSQVVWCNNEISKLEYFAEAIENDVDLSSKYTQEQALDLYNSYQYFTSTSALVIGPFSTASYIDISDVLIFLETDLNISIDENPLQEEFLYQAADFCTTWYQAQNS